MIQALGKTGAGQGTFKGSNNYLLAKFIYRRKTLNQLINGILINNDIANEETKLQLPLGQLLIRILITAYSEAGSSASLNQYLLTFQAVLPLWPDLIGLIDLIEETA